MLTKRDLDHKVALTLGVPVRKVATITSAFIEELCAAVIYHGGFSLIRFGKLFMKIEKYAGGRLVNATPANRIRLYFKKSNALKKQIELQLGLKE